MTVKVCSQAADEAVVSLLRSPRNHHGNGRMKPRPVGEEVCACLSVSYRPRSGLFPQEVSYSPQANQRTKSETEFNSIGPTHMTLMTRVCEEGQQGNDITAGVK